MARQRRPHEQRPPRDEQQAPRPDDALGVGTRVRAKTTARTGEVVHVEQDGDRQHLIVSYDHLPQDEYLTTPARDGAELPRELVVPVDDDGEPTRQT